MERQTENNHHSHYSINPPSNGKRRVPGRCCECGHLQYLVAGCSCIVCGASNDPSLASLETSSQSLSPLPSWSNGGEPSVEDSLAPGGMGAKTSVATTGHDQLTVPHAPTTETTEPPGKPTPLESPSNYYLDTVTFHFSAGSSAFTWAIEQKKKLFDGSWVVKEWHKLLEECVRGDESVKINGCFAGVVWRMKECDSCGRIRPVPISRCQSRYCPECEAIRSRWLATNAYRRIKPFGTKADSVGAFPYFEFTAPKDKHMSLLIKGNIDTWMRIVRESLREWYGVLKPKILCNGWYKDGDIGGLQAFHSWGSNNNFPEPNPHIPVLLAGWLLQGQRKIRIKLQRKEWELNRLRRIYTRRMCEAFGWKKEEIPRDKQGNPFLVVFYGHTWAGGERGEASLMRRLTYMFRAPSPRRSKQGWASLEGLGEDGLGKALAHYMLRKQVRVIRWFGFLNGKEYKKLCEGFGVDPLEWKEKPDYDRCPFCGGHLRDTGEIVVTPIGSGPPQAICLSRAPP